MPANRSRTNEWRRSLQQLQERNGSLEIAVVRKDEKENNRHLLWRVRVLRVTDNEIVIEQPSTLGRTILLREGVQLAAIFSIGQNRWRFDTTVTGSAQFKLNANKEIPAAVLAVPDTVERCQRRNYYRIDTAALCLPQVDMWPLLDPKSVVVAEKACEIAANRAVMNGSDEMLQLNDESIMPEVGPRFSAELTNIGGGGMGIMVNPANASPLGHHKLFWLRFILPPEVKTPICATAKVTHTHMDSTQNTFAGLAFDFSFNPGHQRFVVDQICRYIAQQQRNQLQRSAARETDALRRTA